MGMNAKSKIMTALNLQQKSANQLVPKNVFEMISMAIMCMEKCLSFNFHEKTSDDKLLLAFSRNAVSMQSSGMHQLLRPGPSWKHCLINDNLYKLLMIFHNILYT